MCIRDSRWKSGYKHIIFQPTFEIQELSNVDASYMSIYGKITSRWKKTPMHLEWDIELPANTTGEVHLPDGRKEKIGSGKHHFSVDIPTKNTAILSDEFLYEKAAFPECHGATIVEMKNGDLVASFFGGTKERNPDCCIWAVSYTHLAFSHHSGMRKKSEKVPALRGTLSNVTRTFPSQG